MWTRLTVADLEPHLLNPICSRRTARERAALTDELADRARVAQAILAWRTVADVGEVIDLVCLKDTVVRRSTRIPIVDTALDERASVGAVRARGRLTDEAVVTRRTLRTRVTLWPLWTHLTRSTCVACRTLGTCFPLRTDFTGCTSITRRTLWSDFALRTRRSVADLDGLRAARERSTGTDLGTERTALSRCTVAELELDAECRTVELDARVRLVPVDRAEPEIERTCLGLRAEVLLVDDGGTAVVVLFARRDAHEPHE